MSTPATRRGPYAATRRRREQIAQAVLDLVLESGHDLVTISGVAARSETSEATVLYHFPSKDHLLVAALELAEQHLADDTHADLDSELSVTMDDFRDRLSEASPDDPILRLLTTLRALAANPEHPAADYLRLRTARQIEIFTRLVTARQRDGIAHPALDPQLTATQMIGVWDGLTAMWMLDPSRDLGGAVLDAFRRLTGENVMEARARIREHEFGI